MSARLRALAAETERIVAAGGYRAPDGTEVSLAAAVAAARAGTRMFGPEPLPVPPATGSGTAAEALCATTGSRTAPQAGRATTGSGTAPQAGRAATGSGTVAEALCEVTGESSLEAARRLAARPVAVLNFASARNPGGGYLNGAQAQEEALCRASALHTCLLSARGFYDHHRADRDPFYSDRVIHSPAVPVFRDDRGALLAQPYSAGFLTAAAPNAGVVRRTVPQRAAALPGVLARRAERVLETAVAHGYRRLVLGAWGCGVFRNDPAQVAAAFHGLLGPDGRFSGSFEHVVFGVLDRTPGAAVREAFAKAFA